MFSPGRVTLCESPILPDAFVVVALCVPCWRDLPPAERLPYYQRRMIEARGPNPQENAIRWAAVEYAVRAGA